MDVRPLKGNDAVAAALRSPLRLSSGPLAATIATAESPSATLRYVVNSSRRVVRRAVIRNRIKRLLREALRKAVRANGDKYAHAGLTTIVAIWRSAPPTNVRLCLADVEPHVQTVLRQAISRSASSQSNVPRS